MHKFAVWRAGGNTVRLRADKRISLEGLDGLIVGGGDDISADLYGGEIIPGIKIDKARDDMELLLLKQAYRMKLPILGICRGSQMINISRGGSLHSEISEAYPDFKNVRTILPRKQVHIKKGSRLDQILDCRHCVINALHHQSVDRLGEGLEIVARDEFGIIQATENIDYSTFLIAVQWHPELLIFSKGHQRLFYNLVYAASNFKKEQSK
jgi:putative glutamine amidotransferase